MTPRSVRLLLAVASVALAVGCTAGTAPAGTPDSAIRWSDPGKLTAGEYRSAPTQVETGRYVLSFVAENTACVHGVSLVLDGAELDAIDSFDVTGGETLERPPVDLGAGMYEIRVASAGAHVAQCPWHASLQPE